MPRELTPREIAERSLIKTYRKTIWNPFIAAVKRYELVSPGDHIAVCISGGKDSVVLAKLMQELQKHTEQPFELVFLVMDPGYNPANRALIEENAEKLGIPCYDDQILERMALESGMVPEYLKEQTEMAATRNRFTHVLTSGMFMGNSYQDDLWTLQNKIIHELAEQGPCVFVGFCSEYILRKHDNCLRAFIYADMDFRTKRIVEQYGETDETPEKRIKDKDRRRAAYYQYYTDLKWGASKNYHLSLNSGTLGIDACVDILANLY